MATGGLYGSSTANVVIATAGAESNGLYGGNITFGGSYFEWFIFQESATQPATPTGGSWSFATNTGTAPTGWVLQPPVAPTNQVWVSIALVNSKSGAALTWTTPGLFGVVPQFTFPTPVTGVAGSNASLTNTGTATNPILTFTIPRGNTGATGATGATGPQGATGTAATIAVGTVTTGAAGSSAVITNVGTSGAAIFNFTIPRGDTGATGATGTAATIAVGTTTTGAPSTSATVTNSGTSSAAVFNFTIPRGAGVITGGTTGQVLTKASGTDYDTSWTTPTTGTVTSVAATVPSFLSVSGSPITTSGTLALTYSGTALPVLNGGTGVTVSTGANSVVLRDSSVNISANSISEGFSNVAAAGTTTVLTVASVPNYVVTGSGGQTYQLPDATTLANGTNYTFNNNQSSGTIVVKNNSSTTVATVQSGGYVDVILLSNSIAAGSWDVHNFAPSNVSWSTNTFDYAGSFTSGTWNGNVVAYNRGGTGQSAAFVAGGIVYGSTTSALAVTAVGTSGQVLTSAGTGTPTWTTPTTGTVTSVTGTSPVVSSGGATPAISLATAYGDTLNPYASKTANYVLAAPNGSAGAPTFRAIVAADIPTLNQNTTGSASGGASGAIAATTLSASSTVSGTGFSTYLASPPAIGGTAAAAGTFTTVTATTGISGGTF